MRKRIVRVKRFVAMIVCLAMVFNVQTFGVFAAEIPDLLSEDEMILSSGVDSASETLQENRVISGLGDEITITEDGNMSEDEGQTVEDDTILNDYILTVEDIDRECIISENSISENNIGSSVESDEVYEADETLYSDAINAIGTVTQLSPLNINDAQAEGDLEPFSNHYYGNDKKVTQDLSKNSKLAYSLKFSDKTVFSGLPANFDQNEVIEWNMTPGLGVDILHKHGFDGTGAVIAYADQPINEHEEYKNLNLHYINNTKSDDSMHGPAVLSLLAGKTIGTSPGAEVYYYAYASWENDQAKQAECLYQIIEQNKILPDNKKIRMIGYSYNINSEAANEEEFRKAVKACEDSGVMVWFCGDYDTAYFGPESDRNNPDNAFGQRFCEGSVPKLVFVPASRTTAATLENSKYYYWGSGGLSWTMPYALGVYADALAIDPTLTKKDIQDLIVSTATDNANGIRLINPVEFVAVVLERVGRKADADSLRLDYKNSFHYVYSVMDKSKMTLADITAAEDYLRTIKGVTVLEVDVSSCTSALEVYNTIKNDAQKRGGIIDGIQILGTPDVVPAFNIKYRVQTQEAIDEGGMLKTDLFYGNLENNVDDIGSSYSVYDQFKENKNIVLKPEWPVVRLPLKSGQYASYFEKYGDFALKTRYTRRTLVNFSNPIFAASYHIDDMSLFLDRICNEFKFLKSSEYRLYGNLLGQYPVENKGLLGGFTADNLAAENKTDIVEFLINSHGQRNNIDKCWFEDNREKRESLINSETINTVLSENPYYLDCWTCNNGYDMDSNLTTTALNGNCVGMFSATTIISNNGVNCRASVDKIKQSNFYYFYYSYLKAMHDGNTRAASFYNAQAAYAEALAADSVNGIRGEGNYQYNLYNLFAYENFGIFEPGTFVSSKETNDDPVTEIRIVAGQKINLKTTCFPAVTETISRFVVDNMALASVSKDMFTGKKPGTVKVTAQKQIEKNRYEDVGVCTVIIFNKPQLKFNKNMTYVGQTMNAADYFITQDTKEIGATYWESAKPGVVEVTDSKNGILKAHGNGFARITAYFGEKGKTGTLAVSSTINVKMPAFQKSEYRMLTGAKLTLSMKNVTGASDPEWKAAKDGIIRVTAQTDKKGNKTGKVIVEGLTCGDTKLIATIDGQKYDCTIYVAKPTISKSEMNLKTGQSGTLTLKNTSFKKQDIVWKSANESIAKVDANGKITALTAGNTAIYTEAGGFRNECAVTVAKPVINKTEMEIKAGGTGQLSLKNTNLKKQDIIWKSSNESIATVDAGGKVKGIAVGSAVVYTEAGGVRNECAVTVK